MDKEFNELDDFDDLEIDLNLDDDNQNDNYTYDAFDDYESYDDYIDYNNDYDNYYNTSSYERLDEDNYEEYESYDDDDDDEIKEKPNNIRTIFFKIIIIVSIIALLIWIISLFINSDKKVSNKNDVTVIKTDEINIEETFTKIKNAALKYYKEENTNSEINKTINIQELEKLNLIDNINKTYDLKESNIVLSKNEEHYILKITLISKTEKNDRTYNLNNYSYCTETYLCEKQETTEEENETEEQEENKEEENKEYLYEYINTNETLSSWTKWTEYEKTDCATQKITCADNDSSCLTEVKLYQRKEKIGTQNKVYESSRLAFANAKTESINACSKYDYVKINNAYYRIKKNSNYTVLGAIKKDTQKNYYNWIYNGRASYSTPPSDTINTRYVFVGPDYTNCTNTCNNNLKYYYDSYTFNKKLTKTSKPGKDCDETVKTTVANYSITSQKITLNREEELYGTVCYKSYRTRNLNSNSSTKWSHHNDEELLNNGYKYTGNKKEK